jgi:molybdenum cofactor cytidylyltransferase
VRSVGAIILAAGGSSRFGRPKQLARFGGKSLVRRIVEAAEAAGCSTIVVVIGSEEAKIKQELCQTPVVFVDNQNWESGIGSSIRTGMESLSKITPQIEAVVMLVCDQPAVNARIIESLITTREETKKDIVACSYGDTVGVPALFDRSLFAELLSIADEAGAKSIILQNPERVAQFAFPEGAIDIDTWEDWEKLNGVGHPERSEGSRIN